MIWYDYDELEERVFAYLSYIYKSDLPQKQKDEKIDSIFSIISNKDAHEVMDTYDEYYEDIDERLEEGNNNFYPDDILDSQDKFNCTGLMDDDDLEDFDGLVDMVGEADDYIYYEEGSLELSVEKLARGKNERL